MWQDLLFYNKFYTGGRGHFSSKKVQIENLMTILGSPSPCDESYGKKISSMPKTNGKQGAQNAKGSKLTSHPVLGKKQLRLTQSVTRPACLSVTLGEWGMGGDWVVSELLSW